MKYSILTMLTLALSLPALSEENSNNNPLGSPSAQGASKERVLNSEKAQIDEPVVAGGSAEPANSEQNQQALATSNTDLESDSTENSAEKKSNARSIPTNVSDKAPTLVRNCATKFKTVQEAGKPLTEAQDQDHEICLNADELAQALNGKNYAATASYQTSDGLIKCVQMAGYTLDYQSCRNTARVYNTIVASTMALELQAEIRVQNAQKDIANEAQKKALAGDVQGAGLQASRENSETMKQIHRERAAAYAAAVTALGTSLARWVGDAEDACEKAQERQAVNDCPKKMKILEESAMDDELYPNRAQKDIFATALAKYSAEALKAGMEANKYKKSEEAVAKIQNQYEEDLQDIQFDECVINPTAKKCLGPGEKIAGESFKMGNGSFTIGGADSNSFDFGAGDSDDFNEFGEEANVDSTRVAEINSPFADAAKEANDILDQASAASSGSGEGAAPGGGGGGGGGMGGGGTASLGNDTQTPDESPEEAEIKAKKASAGYASAGAKGFTGVKSSKEDSNPFASLFDQKGSAGGVEEDRSIASNDIDDKS